MNLKYISFVFSVFLFNCMYVEACKGCVNLDELNFNKIIQKFPVTLIKFDVAYPYGEKHEIFSKLSQEIASLQDLLFAEVGVKDYGEKENENLAKLYGITKDDYPAIRLFKKNIDKPISFPTDVEFTVENLRNFLRDNTDIYIGLPGCLEKFDKIASEFVGSDKKETVLEQAENEANKLNQDEDKNSAKTYLTVMKKVIETGAFFINQESERVNKLLQGKISAKKKTELQSKLNIIRAFKIHQKDEL